MLFSIVIIVIFIACFIKFQDVNLILTMILVFMTIIYTLIYALILKEKNEPKLYVVGVISDSNGWDKGIMRDFQENGERERKEGLSLDSANKKLVLEIHNNGNGPATDVHVNYEIVVYANKLKFGIDKADVLEFNLVEYKKVKKSFYFDYIPPGGSLSELIFYISVYPECDLVISLLKSSERGYINKSTIISKFKDNRFFEVSDNHELRRLLGVE